MTFWLLVLGSVSIIPVTMVALGALFSRWAPANINFIFGYRTKMSMLNDETWLFAHNFCGKIMHICGLVICPFSIGVILMFIGQSQVTIQIALLCILLFQTLILLSVVIPTEIALRRNFDKYGNRKFKK